jgi:hypothetical protein
MTTISIDELVSVSGGQAPNVAAQWDQIRRDAGPHCPRTVAANPQPPTSRADAQAVGDACIAEMGGFKANVMGGRAKIQAGIDQAFPR